VNKQHYYTIKVPREVMKKELMRKDIEVELPFEVFLGRATKEIMTQLRDNYRNL